MKRQLFLIFLAFASIANYASDGHKLWLDYKYIGKAEVNIQVKSTENKTNQATLDIIKKELHDYYNGKTVDIVITGETGKCYFSISGNTICGSDEYTALYGAYALLRSQATLSKAKNFAITDSTTVKYRLLNHWDNLDGSIERGYAGKSIFFPTYDSRLIREYARANASIGINGSVIDNVNASPKILTKEYLMHLKGIADILRPYGIKTYLSINFGSPKALGATKTADPLNASVVRWWQKKVKEIYKLVPDFGGFLVKASSEGQPGPNDYGRTHAEGANMLADALKPYGGIVMWRSFVYGANHKGEDRVMQAVSEFKALDGKFHSNVILQSKNGPLDFQPREPYAPIFDNITNTPQMAEFQITQEYTGQSKHLVYLAPMWQEFFSFVSKDKLIGVAGVSNIGNDRNWCGHDFSQANWYAFGRMLWDERDARATSDISEKIAVEWIQQTFHCNDFYFVSQVKNMMMTSREACVDYMMPLGLHHIFAFDHHYGPEPDGYKADCPIEWCPVYYHRADSIGIGFDRTMATGSGATGQYREPYRSMYEDITTCPEQYLLWFHHVPWNYKMKDGNTLWQDLIMHYTKGLNQTSRYLDTWENIESYVDPETWQRVDELLKVQNKNALKWKTTCLEYFSKFSKLSPTLSLHQK